MKVETVDCEPIQFDFDDVSVRHMPIEDEDDELEKYLEKLSKRTRFVTIPAVGLPQIKTMKIDNFDEDTYLENKRKEETRGPNYFLTFMGQKLKYKPSSSEPGFDLRPIDSVSSMKTTLSKMHISLPETARILLNHGSFENKPIEILVDPRQPRSYYNIQAILHEFISTNLTIVATPMYSMENKWNRIEIVITITSNEVSEDGTPLRITNTEKIPNRPPSPPVKRGMFGIERPPTYTDLPQSFSFFGPLPPSYKHLSPQSTRSLPFDDFKSDFYCSWRKKSSNIVQLANLQKHTCILGRDWLDALHDFTYKTNNNPDL